MKSSIPGQGSLGHPLTRSWEWRLATKGQANNIPRLQCTHKDVYGSIHAEDGAPETNHDEKQSSKPRSTKQSPVVPRNVKIKKHKERVANASTEKNNGEAATEHSVASGSRGQDLEEQ